MNIEIWDKTLSTLQTNINKQSYDMWLKDTEPMSISDNTIKIRVVDDVARHHISENYSKQIESIIQDITGKKYICEFITSNNFSKQNINENVISTNHEDINEKLTNFSDNSNTSVRSILNPNYTFDNFVVGPNNQLAHAASNAVSIAPAKQYNPLFIYGGTGLGKTHLMQAIGHHIIDNKPFLKVLYVPTEQFINEFIQSIRTNTTESFKIKYRNIDILLIDDIQFIEKKEETQNEFFHTFNTLYDNNKQIIITSDRPPKQLSTLTDRLRSRFEWGMITDIQPPNLETREAILRNNAEKVNLNVSDEALNYIARRIKSTIRALEAALSRLKMVSILYNEPITVQHAKLHLRDLFDGDINKSVSIRDIIKRISDEGNVSIEEIKSKSRHSRIVQPRFKAMYISRQLTDLTYDEIGKEFGGRDHSTVVNAINQIEIDMKVNTELKENIDDIILELKS
ncbi:chromosomal replication initiator protein DnaA [Spirochaetota bacterium]